MTSTRPLVPACSTDSAWSPVAVRVMGTNTVLPGSLTHNINMVFSGNKGHRGRGHSSRTMDPDMAPGGSTGQDPIVPCGITSCSHQAVPHSPQSQFCPFTGPTSSASLSLHFSTTYLLFLVTPAVSECLGSSQEWSQEFSALLVYHGARQESY